MFQSIAQDPEPADKNDEKPNQHKFISKKSTLICICFKIDLKFEIDLKI
jgi:hypothetical protein